MRDNELVTIADLLLKAKGLIAEDHPPVLGFAVDLALLEVGRGLANSMDVAGPHTGGMAIGCRQPDASGGTRPSQ